jgi:hypothetical protein
VPRAVSILVRVAPRQINTKVPTQQPYLLTLGGRPNPALSQRLYQLFPDAHADAFPPPDDHMPRAKTEKKLPSAVACAACGVRRRDCGCDTEEEEEVGNAGKRGRNAADRNAYISPVPDADELEESDR